MNQKKHQGGHVGEQQEEQAGEQGGKHEKKQKIEPIRRVRGMQDFLPERAAGMRRIARIAEDVSRLYGFERIEIPILERAGLYRRSLGLGSDVVMKEMYAFEDKNGDELCLRPEGTAGVMRMLIDAGLTQTLPQRWFYEGAMFRRERPQKGRFRQFHQCGVEMLSTRYDFMTADFEVLKCAWHFLKELGLQDKVELKYNWLGTTEERTQYSTLLAQHFQQYADDALSLESVERLKRGNALRIFDSKDPADQEAIREAPIFELNEQSKKSVENMKNWLENHFNMPYVYDPRLVRGLDYYSHLVYEFVEKGSTREQATVLAGGRYDGLHEQIGGRASEHPVTGVGWAAGLERLLDLSSPSSDFHSTTKNIKIFLTDDSSMYIVHGDPEKQLSAITIRINNFEDFRKKLYSNIVTKNANVIFPIAGADDVRMKENADFLITRRMKDEKIENDLFSLRIFKKGKNYSIPSENENENGIIEELKKQIENFSRESEDPQPS